MEPALEKKPLAITAFDLQVLKTLQAVKAGHLVSCHRIGRNMKEMGFPVDYQPHNDRYPTVGMSLGRLRKQNLVKRISRQGESCWGRWYITPAGKELLQEIPG